jgi:tRNA(Ile2) C34 agmatinyltransferase TiaS
MNTQAVTLALVVLGAGLLATIAVGAVQMARLCATPKCPGCEGSEVTEDARHYKCELCGQRWRLETPKRFGTYGGGDL